jgi:hypothetical protein
VASARVVQGCACISKTRARLGDKSAGLCTPTATRTARAVRLCARTTLHERLNRMSHRTDGLRRKGMLPSMHDCVFLSFVCFLPLQTDTILVHDYDRAFALLHLSRLLSHPLTPSARWRCRHLAKETHHLQRYHERRAHKGKQPRKRSLQELLAIEGALTDTLGKQKVEEMVSTTQKDRNGGNEEPPREVGRAPPPTWCPRVCLPVCCLLGVCHRCDP